MAKVYKVEDLLEMEDGTLLTGAVNGKVKVIFEGKSGKSDDGGTWRFQTFILEDGTGEVRCSLKDQPRFAPPDWKGKKINLIAKKGTKGWSGLKMVEDDYKGKKQLVLRITPSAEIICGNDTMSGEAAEADAEPAEAPEESAEAEDAPEKTKPHHPPYTHDKNMRQIKPETSDAPTSSKDELMAKKVIELNRYLGRQSTLMALAAAATVRSIEHFLNAHLPEGQTEKVTSEELSNYISLVAKNMCSTSFTTMYLSIEDSMDTPEVPSITKLEKIIELAKTMMKK